MKTRLNVVAVTLLVLCAWACSTVNRTAYVTSGASRVTVEAGMGLFNQLIKDGKVTPAQEQVVKNIYIKVQSSMIVLCDAGKSASAATSTNTLTSFSQVLAQTSADFQQNLGDLQKALAQFNIHI